jgi:hypothetical protein
MATMKKRLRQRRALERRREDARKYQDILMGQLPKEVRQSYEDRWRKAQNEVGILELRLGREA